MRISTNLLVFCYVFYFASIALAQSPAPSPVLPPSPASAVPPTPPTAADILSQEKGCVGVYLIYQLLESPVIIPPFTSNLSAQPYKFVSQVTLINNGYEPVPAWELSIDFQYEEVIAQAENVLFLTGGTPPGLAVGNNTRIVGEGSSGLLTSIDTAGNLALISFNFTLVGTEFGQNGSKVPLPSNLTMVTVGYTCGAPTVNSTQMGVCCVENKTEIESNNGNLESGYLPREKGDVTISYDIMSAYSDNYWAQVSIDLEDPLGRIDNWNLTWEWTEGEFIELMKGAQILGPNDQDKCVLGLAAVQYPGMDFQNVMSCSPNPVIVDLAQDLANDATVGIPNCCRNGSLITGLVDPTFNVSNFQLQVRKLPPHLTTQDLTPPSNWKISEGYQCGPPRLVSPTEFSPLTVHSSSAVASWQVVCNLTVSATKKCCVSFSAYYNDTAIPCPTSSCDATRTTFPWNGQTCNRTAPALLLPYSALLKPPSNRTALSQALARIDHYTIPSGPLPCPDSCGVSINWHVYSNYANGWSARMTLFNWETTEVVDWFAGVELPVAAPGFQNAYSFNSLKKVPDFNNTLFVEGQEFYNNYLLEMDPEDNPGKLQSVLSFDKRKTPGISYTKEDYFPSKVWFNGEECAIPDMFPGGSGWQIVPTIQLAFVVIATVFLLEGRAATRIW